MCASKIGQCFHGCLAVNVPTVGTGNIPTEHNKISGIVLQCQYVGKIMRFIVKKMFNVKNS